MGANSATGAQCHSHLGGYSQSGGHNVQRLSVAGALLGVALVLEDRGGRGGENLHRFDGDTWQLLLSSHGVVSGHGVRTQQHGSGASAIIRAGWATGGGAVTFYTETPDGLAQFKPGVEYTVVECDGERVAIWEDGTMVRMKEQDDVDGAC